MQILASAPVWAGIAIPSIAFPIPQGTPYAELTNTHRAVTNFNVETTRGMALTDSGRLLAINTHGSLLQVLNPGSTTFDVTAPTLNNPVSIGAFTEVTEDGSRELAVVLCAGSHALALHDVRNGRILDLLQLDAEPGDVIVDQDNGWCHVSLPGNNTVLQVALPSLNVDAVHSVASQRPRYLNLDLGDLDTPDDNQVFVTPELSGNNSISETARDDSFLSNFGALGNGSFDNIQAFSLVTSLPEGLPDEDLFRLDPQPSGGATASVSAVAVLRNAGTLLMAHGRNPATEEYWIVGTESFNTLSDDEPSIKGIFCQNRLTIAPTLHAGAAVAHQSLPYTNTVVDLDLAGGALGAAHSISLPTGLTFHPSGVAAIVGIASDRIRVADNAGARVGEQLMPTGSIPRHILFSADGLVSFVYCWGTNEIRIYDVAAVFNSVVFSPGNQAPTTVGLLGVLDLGVDPTPAGVARGREIFYDAERSLNARTTCAHCHPGGGMDLLGWNIRDFPHDHKDLMVTQSLKSIEDTFPYHWRGERDLEAFNGAFAGLLGGQLLTTDTTDPVLVAAGLTTDTNGIDGDETSEFEDFKAFVFSLQVHANPNQHVSRELVPAMSVPQHFLDVPLGGGTTGVPNTGSGNPATGQTLMTKANTLLGRFSCADCHGLPAGTVGDPQMDDLGTIPGNRNMDVAHFRQIFHKNQDLVNVNLIYPGFGMQNANVPRGGFGLSHDGNHASVLDFLLRNPFTLDSTLNEQGDLAAFVQQADEGITPAAHRAYLLNSTTPAGVWTEIANTILPQAGASFTAAHWLSLAIVGQHEDSSGTVHDLRWYYLPSSGAFVPSDRTLTFPNAVTGSQTWAALQAEATAGRASFVLLGLPPGNSIRWAVDRDNDLLDDTDEAAIGSLPMVADTDGDLDLDGHEFSNSGDPVNGAVQSSDSTAPALVYARIDHSGASYAKLVLWFSEPVRYSVTATSASSGAAVERRFDHVWYDTVTVQRLVPSLPSMSIPGPGPLTSVSAVANNYSYVVEMTDLSGNTATTGVIATGATRDQLVLLPLTPSVGTSNVPPAFLSRTISNLAWNGTPSGTSFQADVAVTHRYNAVEVTSAYSIPAQAPNQSASPVDRQVVAAQVIHEDASGNRTVLPTSGGGMLVSSPSGLIFPDVLTAVSGSGTAPIAITGPFLLSTTTGPAGTATFDFDLSTPLGAGESVHLNVIGIFEQDQAIAPQPANVFWLPSIATYNKPATPVEFRSLQFP